MSWSNYIIIPKLKLIIEVSRDIDEGEYYEYEDEAKNFFDLIEYIREEFDYDSLETPLKSITLKDLSHILQVARKSVDALLHIYDYDYLLIYWLISRNIKFEIMNEFEFNEKKNKFKDYKIIKRFDEEEEDE